MMKVVVVRFSVLVVISLGASATTAPNRECVYLQNHSGSASLNASYLPSVTVSTTCINPINALEPGAAGYPDLKHYQNVGSASCQSFYDLSVHATAAYRRIGTLARTAEVMPEVIAP